MNFIIVFLINSIYWILAFLIIHFLLNSIYEKLTFQMPYSKLFFNFSKLIRPFKDKLPEVSQFNKKKLNSFHGSYLKLYSNELNKAFLMHIIPIVFVIPYLMISYELFLIILLIYIIFNLPFIMITYYNQIRLQKILKKKVT